MRKLYFIKLAFSEFAVHKRRFVLTSLAIAWGTCTILVLLAFGEGLKRQLVQSMEEMGDNLVVVWAGQTSRPYQGLPAGRFIQFTKDDIKLIRESIPEIKAVSGEYRNRDIPASAGTRSASIMIGGANEEFGRIRSQIPYMGGRFLHSADIRHKRRVIFMGWEVVSRFYNPFDAVGKTIIINKLPFIIIGVLKEKVQRGNYGGEEKRRSYIPESTFETMFGYPNYRQIVYSLRDPSMSLIAEQKLYRVLGAKYKFDPDDKAALSVWNTVETLKRTKKVFTALQIFLGFMGGLTLLISGVGLANIMYVSIKLRTREIGVKVALGAYPMQILWQIVTETFFFSIVGGTLGTAAAVIAVALIRKLPITNEALAFLKSPKLSLDIGIASAIILIIITFCAGFFPARRAALQDPLSSLRYE